MSLIVQIVGLKLRYKIDTSLFLTLQILEVDKENSRIFVTYTYWSSRWDAWIDNIHDRVAPLNTHTYYEGGPFKIGQRIEAFHFMSKRWLEAFILTIATSEVRCTITAAPVNCV